MDRDAVIITGYGRVCEPYHALQGASSLRRGGFAPALTDEEVSTMEICGAYFKRSTAKAIWASFRPHYHPCLPPLGDRPLLGRQAANLWPRKAAIQQRLTHVSGQAYAPSQPIATLPLPVCV
jgi:hypothetical protein